MRTFTYVTIALIATAISVPFARTGFAQAGSTGGTVGNRDKSVSGGSKREPERPAARRTPHRREEGAPLSRYDGSWAGVSVGRCIGQLGWSVQVSNGVISGPGTTGGVKRNGTLNGVMEALGTRYVFKGVGHASGQASGTWTSSPECSGSWTAVRS